MMFKVQVQQQLSIEASNAELMKSILNAWIYFEKVFTYDTSVIRSLLFVLVL